MTPEQALQMICLAAEQVIPVAKLKEYQAAYQLLSKLIENAQAAENEKAASK